MNNYTLVNYWQNNKANKRLSQKKLNEIDKRRLFALKTNSLTEIEDAKTKIVNIIDKDGLDNENEKVRLETAIKTLGYVTPQKKAIETTIIVKKIEDIIKESTKEAEFTEIESSNNGEETQESGKGTRKGS